MEYAEVDLALSPPPKGWTTNLTLQTMNRAYSGPLLLREIALLSNTVHLDWRNLLWIQIVRFTIPFLVRLYEDKAVFGENGYEYTILVLLNVAGLMVKVRNMAFVLFGVVAVKRKYL